MNPKLDKHKRQRSLGVAWRIVSSLLLVLAFHALLFCVFWMKSQRNVKKETPVQKEPLRIWSMSEEDAQLQPEAKDFLRSTSVILRDVDSIRINVTSTNLEDILYGDNISAQETSKLKDGLRLSWNVLTQRLDNHLNANSVSPKNVSLALTPHQTTIFKGSLSLAYDLEAFNLETSRRISDASIQTNQRLTSVVPRPVPTVGVVTVSKYENSSWRPVNPDELTQKASSILKTVTGGLPGQNSCQAKVEVLGGGARGARVHLRHSCGVPELDKAVLAWVMQRHRWKGHFRTDTAVELSRDSALYVFEFGETPPP